MGNLGTKISDFTEDFRNSWWFRLWAIFWVICFIFAFVAFILFSARSSEDEAEKGWRMWTKDYDSIVMPNFQFRTQLDQPGNVMVGGNCTWQDTMWLANKTCNDKDSVEICAEWDTQGVAATPNKNFLRCYVNVNMLPGVSEFLAFRVATGVNFDPNDVWTFLQPSTTSYISLRLTRVKPSNKGWKDMWHPRVSYREITAVKGLFDIIIQMEGFDVLNYEKTTWYTGWMAAADIGGFAFFLYILHWLVMQFLAIFLDPSSKFLGTAGVEQPRYNSL